ncbi:hypothetical protein ACF08M_11395 [Streptomyces sp. NPDC015032]|uniref:hypothetical protein n=1 Tax=Streptomyces sp. NPDC015032 TaxID=3364937 RepID=UPI0036FA58A4
MSGNRRPMAADDRHVYVLVGIVEHKVPRPTDAGLTATSDTMRPRGAVHEVCRGGPGQRCHGAAYRLPQAQRCCGVAYRLLPA